MLGCGRRLEGLFVVIDFLRSLTKTKKNQEHIEKPGFSVGACLPRYSVKYMIVLKYSDLTIKYFRERIFVFDHLHDSEPLL